MSTEAAAQARCPTCGAKLARTNLSLCAYCGSPLAIGAKPAPPDDEVTRRLVRLRQHAEFQAKLDWNPADLEAEKRNKLLALAGSVDTAAGAVLIVVGLVRGGEFPNLWLIIGGASLVSGIAVLAVAKALRTRARMQPMLKRPALVKDRRSETDIQSGGTTYYFTLRFDDGSEGEFRFQGRGTQYEPMSNGAAGIAYSRGERLLDFHRITG